MDWKEPNTPSPFNVKITLHISRLIPQWFLDNKYTVYQIYIKQHNIKLKFEHKQILIICYVVTCFTYQCYLSLFLRMVYSQNSRVVKVGPSSSDVIIW